MFNSRMNHLRTLCTVILTKTPDDSRANVSPSSTSGLTFPSSFNIISHRHLIFALASPKTLLCTTVTLKIVFRVKSTNSTKFVRPVSFSDLL